MLSVKDSRELQAAILATRAAGKDLRRALYADARSELGNAWLPALQRRTASRMDRAVMLRGARVQVGGDGFRVMAATSRRAIKPGGLVPADDWAGVEFGARTARARYNRRSRNGGTHTVTRTVNRQFRGRVKQGRIAFDAASELGTRLVAVWVSSIVSTYRRAARED